MVEYTKLQFCSLPGAEDALKELYERLVEFCTLDGSVEPLSSHFHKFFARQPWSASASQFLESQDSVIQARLLDNTLVQPIGPLAKQINKIVRLRTLLYAISSKTPSPYLHYNYQS